MGKNRLFNDGWLFTKQPLDTTLEQINQKENEFEVVDIPHDWLIYNTLDLYEDSTGWYKKKLHLKKQQNELYFIRFDGVYMDSTVYVNNQKVGEWKYGYSAFEMDLTDFLRDGENEIKVSVRHQSPNSRWYSGAGIYRNVWFKKVKTTHIISDGIYVTATPVLEEPSLQLEESLWQVDLDTEVICKEEAILSYRLCHKETKEVIPLLIFTEKDANEVESFTYNQVVNPSKEIQGIHSIFYVKRPYLWDIENPVLYELQTELIVSEEVIQREDATLGFRTLAYEPKQGLFLNNRQVKLNGVCEHHDLGCLGAAYNQVAMKRKFVMLQKMGVNAIRTAHNMPAKEMMDLADEMGMLIVSESFDMWEKAKTTYDYARFFKEWYKKDVESWIRRDRNHPSIIMWSIGNEIYDTHASERGQEITRLLLGEVHKHDPRHHAPVTIGSNYMPWENAQKCADIVKVAGYNYSEKYYEQHHKAHPDWIIYGSETGSVVQSRGVYHFPFSQSVLADDDEQCSALGNSTTSWGAKSVETCIINERDCHFSCGQFLWTGYDYIGEPTPYHTKNSYFGQIDTAGFAKDSYYMYQAEWTDYKKAPMIHIFPYWDFNEGQLIDVRVCSNAPRIELFFNGESQGIFEIDHQQGEQLIGHWQLPYTVGELLAVAYDENNHIIATESKKSFGEPTRIILTPDKTEILGDGEDLIFVEINMMDAEGNLVENANNRVEVNVTGRGRLLGLDNGDSTDYDAYKGTSRRLFSGKLIAVIGTTLEKNPDNEDEIDIIVSSVDLPDEVLTLKVLPCIPREGVSAKISNVSLPRICGNIGEAIDIPVRKIEIISESGNELNDKYTMAKVSANIYPVNATDQELIWSVVDDAGIPSSIATVKADGKEAIVTALSDGKFRLRCMSQNGTGHIRLISQLDFRVTGLGEAYLNPYQFISGGLFTYSKGTLTNGNERGVATARDGETQVGFQKIDFGNYGSDEITIPIFALSDEEYPIEIWEGIPNEKDSQLVAQVVYQKPSIWNVYQEETFKLNKRIKGISTICFVLNQKIHIKGFSFKKINRAFETLCANENDQIYGDQFTVVSDGVKGIGNNVTLTFNEMAFGAEGVSKLVICGHSPIDKNSIHIRFNSEDGEIKNLIEFLYTEEAEARTYDLHRITGTQNVSFVFLPGSQFDFKWLRFEA